MSHNQRFHQVDYDLPQPVLEDPWDVSAPARGTPRSRVARVEHSWLFGWFWILTVGLVLIAGLIRAQAPPIMSDELEGHRRTTVHLSQEAELLAEDYLFLLEQLSLLASDYAEYFGELEAEQARECTRNLIETRRLLQDTAAFSDYLRMARYLTDWQEKLAEHEEVIQESQRDTRRDLMDELSLLDQEMQDYRNDIAKLEREASAIEAEIDRSGDPDYDLIDELEQVLAELEDTEKELKSLKRERSTQARDIQHGTESYRLYRLAHGLQREVSVLQDMFEESVVAGLEDNRELRVTVEAHVRQSVAARLAQLSLPQLEALEIPGPAPEVYPAPETTQVPSPLPPMLPVPWVDVVGTERYFPGPTGGASMIREMTDSAKVGSTELPIIVVNPIGLLKIIGQNRDYVTATCEVEVTAGTRTKAENLIEKIDLRIYERKKAVFVEIVVPELTDPSVMIQHSLVKISAPRSNPVVVKTTGGQASISDFDNGARLNTTNCDLAISNMTGKIDVVSSMGRVVLTDVTGPMALSNSYQPLELYRCRGKMEIKNVYSMISLTDCTGSANVTNTGPTRIIGFAGSIAVQNSNGLLELEDIDGDVTAFNKFQPMLIRDVSGSATIQNARGLVLLQSVEGQLSVTNTYAPIAVHSPGGPVYLVNRQGDIDISLNNRLLGPSTILNEGGSVNITLGSQPDILLTMEAVGGNIISTLPLEVERQGNKRSVRMSLGSASSTLAITGTDTEIVIMEH